MHLMIVNPDCKYMIPTIEELATLLLIELTCPPSIWDFGSNSVSTDGLKGDAQGTPMSFYLHKNELTVFKLC